MATTYGIRKKEEEEWCRLALGVKKLGFSLAVFFGNCFFLRQWKGFSFYLGTLSSASCLYVYYVISFFCISPWGYY
jgi:hypothetical protein